MKQVIIFGGKSTRSVSYYLLVMSEVPGLYRDTVSEVMHTHDPDAFAGRDPTAKEVHRAVLKPSGTHEWWSGDGHDKLKSIGFALWMMVNYPVLREYNLT